MGRYNNVSLELKRAMVRKRYPEYCNDEIRHLMVKEYSDEKKRSRKDGY